MTNKDGYAILVIYVILFGIAQPNGTILDRMLVGVLAILTLGVSAIFYKKSKSAWRKVRMRNKAQRAVDELIRKSTEGKDG